MLQAIVRWSLTNRIAVVVLAALLVVVGAYAAGNSKLDVLPEFAPVRVVVQTEAPGLSAVEVEQLVTLPIEQAINGAPDVAVVRSRSLQGLSAVTVVFEDRADISRARQTVSERLGEVELPEGVMKPRVGPTIRPGGRLLVVGFTGLSPQELRERVQDEVRPRLLAVHGVAMVTLFGGEVRQFQVLINPDYLAAHRLTLTQVLDAARQASGVRGAGFQEGANQRLVLRVEGQLFSADDLGEAVINVSNGTPVRLKDVAVVREGAEPKFGDAAINGRPGVALAVYKQPDGDTAQITERVEAELEKLRPELARHGVAYHPALFRQANFIDRAASNVTASLLLGAALVAAVLFLLMFNLRAALVSLTAMALSLSGAIAVLWAWDVGLNALTLAGLAVAVGIVADDAVVDVENILRRLRQNARLAHPRSAIEVVLSASLEVRGAAVYATLIMLLVLVPVFFLSGIQGRLLIPLGCAYALAVLASLAVALTVTPALSLLFLTSAEGARGSRQAAATSAEGANEPPLLCWLEARYAWLLRRLDREFPLIATVTLMLIVAAGWAFSGFRGELLPEPRESHLVIHMQGAPGTSLHQSISAGNAVARELKSHPAVLGVSQLAGRAELGEDTWGVEHSELEVPLHPLDADSAERAARSIRQTLRDRFPGFSFSVYSFHSEFIHKTLSGSIAPVAVKLYGNDLEALDRAAAEVARVLAAVPGSDGVRAEVQTGQPELVIRPRPEDVARYNLRAAQVLDTIHATYQGAQVAQSHDGGRVINLVAILDPGLRNDPTIVGDLWLNTPGGRVQLKQVADVYLSDGRFLVAHEGGRRRQLVTCNVQGRDVKSFVSEAGRRVKEVDLPSGVSCVFTGDHEAGQAPQRELLLPGLAAGVGILLLLWTALGSFRLLLVVLLNLPFALIGGVAAVYMTGGALGLGGLIGFVALLGITIRNAIVMVSHWRHLHEAEGMAWGAELVYRGARERLAPILMTALVTGLGVLPLALGSGEAGREIAGPLTLVILGGLATSTTLNLLVLPVFVRRLGIDFLATPLSS